MLASSLRSIAGTAPVPGERPVPYTPAETILLLVAALALVGALIHVGAGIDHWREYHLYTVVFSSLAVLQAAWAVLILRGAGTRVLVLGAIMQTGIVLLWSLSRTVGVPLAPKAWTPESIGVADLIETLGEIVTVLAVASVLWRDTTRVAGLARTAMIPLLVAALLVSALFGAGAHAG
jgi:hypothetical protein